MKRLGQGSMGLVMCAWILLGCDTHKAQSLGGDNTDIPLNDNTGGETGNDSQTGQAGEMGYNWKDSALLADVPLQGFSGENYGSAFYQDIMSHTKPDYYDEPATSVHETLHTLHSEMRQKTKTHDAFVYHRDGQGIYIPEPKENLIDVKNHIGASFQELAKYNYDTYLIKQLKYWKNTLYLFDEWACYIATTRTAIEAQAAGKWTETFASSHTDPIEGLVTFMYFNSAAILSIKNVDPDYLKTNQQYKAAYAMTMEESMHWINQARANKFWSTSRAYGKLKNLQTAEDAATVRAAVKGLMGDTWTKRVLGF